MYKSVELVKIKFSEEMKRCCMNKYKVTPSNAQLSKDFYSATQYKLKVNQETFRLWMKGESFPDLNSLLYLIEWLDLDLNNIFNINDNLGMKNNSKIIQNELDIASMNKLTEKNIDSVIDILSSFKKNVGYKNS
jgi:hypothetical protein